MSPAFCFLLSSQSALCPHPDRTAYCFRPHSWKETDPAIVVAVVGKVAGQGTIKGQKIASQGSRRLTSQILYCLYPNPKKACMGARP